MAYYKGEWLPWPRQPPNQIPNSFAHHWPSTSSYNTNYHESISGIHPRYRKGPVLKERDEQSPKQSITKKETLQSMQKCLLEGISKPVESSKAERMMKMMGWKGEMLGRNGEGLQTPLAPNFKYNTGAGLGHSMEEIERQSVKKKSNFGSAHTAHTQPNSTRNKPKGTRIKKSRMKLKSRLEALQDILTFVKDNRSTEMKFSVSLKDGERKIVHRMVECVREEASDINFIACHRELMSVFEEICEINEYVLQSQSEGNRPWRQLVVFKEAPEHVYLITKDDLEEDGDEEYDFDSDEADSVHNEVDLVFESDTLLKGITIKQDTPEVPENRSLTATENMLENVEVKEEGGEEVTIDSQEEENGDHGKKENTTDKNIITDTVPFKEETVTSGKKEKNEHVEKENSMNEECIRKDTVSVKVENANEEVKIVTCVKTGTSTMLVELESVSKEENKKIDGVTVKTEYATNDEATKMDNVSVKKENTNKETKNDTVVLKKENTINELNIKRENVPVKIENPKTKTYKTGLDRKTFLRKILKKYLKEFFESAEYTELRFLGAFDVIEQNVLDELMLKLHHHLASDGLKDDWVSKTVMGDTFAIKLDKNNCEIVIKT